MYTALQLTAALSLLLHAAASPIVSAATESGSQLRVPLNIHDKRQYSDDLDVRQEWLRQQGQGLRRKYASRLGAAGQALVRRDMEEERVRLSKRASGTAT